MKVTLYGIPGSHPVRTVRLMLEYKDIPYKNVDVLPVISRVLVPYVLRFPGNRVPALKIDDRKVQGSLEIAQELERTKPEPPLFPADPEQRKKIEQLVTWGDEFQQIPRSIMWWPLKRASLKERESFLREARFGVPTSVLARTSAPLIWAEGKMNDSTDENVRRLIAELPQQLDQIDAWIADGTLNGEQLNAADYQIGTSIRLLMTMADLRPMIEARPAGALAKRVQPDQPGDVGPMLPAGWLEALKSPAAV